MLWRTSDSLSSRPSGNVRNCTYPRQSRTKSRRAADWPRQMLREYRPKGRVSVFCQYPPSLTVLPPGYNPSNLCKRRLLQLSSYAIIHTGQSKRAGRLIMKKTNISFKWKLFVLTLSLLTLMGCARENNNLTENQSAENHTSKNTSQMEESFMDTTEQIEEETVEPIIMDVDWSDYFEEINGSDRKSVV